MAPSFTINKLRSEQVVTILLFTAATAILPVFNLLLPMFLSQFISQDELGQYFLLMTFLGLATTWSAFGVSSLAQNRAIKDEAFDQEWKISLLAGMACLFASLAIVPAYGLLPIAIALSSVTMSNINFGMAIYIGNRNLKGLAALLLILMLIASAIFVLVGIVPAPATISIRFYIFALLAPIFVSAFAKQSGVKSFYFRSRNEMVAGREIGIKGALIFANSLLIMGFMLTDRLVITVFLGYESLATYSVYAQWLALLPLFGSVLNKIDLPAMHSLTKGQQVNHAQFKNLVISFSLKVALAGIFVLALLLAISPEKIYNGNVSESNFLAVLLALSNIVYAISTLLNKIRHFTGRISSLVTAAIASNIANVVLSIPLALYLDLVGVAIATTIAVSTYTGLVYRGLLK